MHIYEKQCLNLDAMEQSYSLVIYKLMSNTQRFSASLWNLILSPLVNADIG